jgi:hypothetical protein
MGLSLSAKLQALPIRTSNNTQHYCVSYILIMLLILLRAAMMRPATGLRMAASSAVTVPDLLVKTEQLKLLSTVSYSNPRSMQMLRVRSV